MHNHKWVGATKMQQNVSPVVKNPSSTHLFGNLPADYLMASEPKKTYGGIFRAMSFIFCWSSYNHLGRDNKSHLAAGLHLNSSMYAHYNYLGHDNKIHLAAGLDLIIFHVMRFLSRT